MVFILAMGKPRQRSNSFGTTHWSQGQTAADVFAWVFFQFTVKGEEEGGWERRWDEKPR